MTFVEVCWKHPVRTMSTIISRDYDGKQSTYNKFRLYARVLSVRLLDFRKRARGRGWTVPTVSVGAKFANLAEQFLPAVLEEYYGYLDRVQLPALARVQMMSRH